MNIQKLKSTWFSGWRIIGRLFLLYLAMLLFWLPLLIATELHSKTAADVPVTAASRYGGALFGVVLFLVVLPYSVYYAAKWCKEFKDETE